MNTTVTGYWGKLKRDDETGEVQSWHPLAAPLGTLIARGELTAGSFPQQVNPFSRGR